MMLQIFLLLIDTSMLCVKKKFKTEKDAELALEHIRNVRIKYRREKHPIRYYECEYCRCYHLTSQPAPQEDVSLIHLDKFKKLIQSDD
jgi:hypothetical protein